uniref:NS2 n=1 Tax=uncultured densovirus TaxID=748192 RepID=A0A7L7YQH9_9VIRU|nr:NS2 [uncultured densovirus]
MTEHLENSQMSDTEEMTYKTKDVVEEILNQQKPLSKTHPGYLQMFIQYLENLDQNDNDLKMVIKDLSKISQVWQNQEQKASRDGVLEYLTSCRGLLGITLVTSLSVSTMNKLQALLTTFEEEQKPTNADCSLCVSIAKQSRSSMTAASATTRVDVRGSRKRKLCMDSDEEEDLSEDDLYATNSKYPTSRTFSSISRKVKGEPNTLKLEDEWKEYQMKIQLWRSKDLKECKDWKDKANKVHKTLIMNFDENYSKLLMNALGDIEEVLKRYLRKGGAKKEVNRYGGWKQ